MKSKILHIKTYNRNEHLKSFCKYFWLGFTGKSGNIIDFTWNKDMQKFISIVSEDLKDVFPECEIALQITDK